VAVVEQPPRGGGDATIGRTCAPLACIWMPLSVGVIGCMVTGGLAEAMRLRRGCWASMVRRDGWSAVTLALSRMYTCAMGMCTIEPRMGRLLVGPYELSPRQSRSLIQDSSLLSSCESSLHLYKSLSTCAEQVTLVLTSSHGPLEP
jgi:hypothetical protein